jgi:site-specific recombinase XerD
VSKHPLLAQLLYGIGLRVSEALQLRVKDLNFANHALVVCSGKGGKDRIVMLPQRLHIKLRGQLARAQSLVRQRRGRTGQCGDTPHTRT